MQFGDYRVEIIPDTEFRLDGGAMFGVVPWNLWSRACPPDEQNRIRMNMNCVFVEAGAEKILIETGIGEKLPAKQTAMYGITRKRSLGDSLRAIAGVGPEEITIVINTHLHFDHAGGNTKLEDSGRAIPAFPNARYFVSRAEFEHAEDPSERDRASYLPDNWQPLHASGQLELKAANYEVVSGLRLENHPGHNRSMQCWRLDREGRTLFGFADLVPMRAHVSFAWIMGYDLYPVETLEAKKKLLPQAARENWTCLFYHDPDSPVCRIVDDDGKLRGVALQD
ncbi:MAG TPA: MBL fold metallo-hydrolase [Pyrinomonadaceae bacterium]|nr:MBL fold metallo-hydrolase [Pyrinomonadaceae bacterium]